MVDVVLQVLDQVGVGVVCHDDVRGAFYCARETGEAGPGAELEDGFVEDEGGGVLFDVGCEGSAGVPEVVALDDALVFGFRQG